MTTERDIRLQKLNNLRAAGHNPYPDRFTRTHSLAEAKNLPLGTPVQVAGRLILKREMGKLLFGHLLDWSGQLQIVLNTDSVGAEEYKLFTKNIDVADFLGVEGEMFQTQKGEISVHVTRWTILSKALRPLPEKWHGLADQEACYRERHLDLIMNEDTRARFQFRSDFIRYLREFYWQNGFTEVDTPVISPTASGALAKPFITHHNALDADFYLRIAPETYLKKATVGGWERIFEVARCFRNEGIDPSHLQEFSMCEHYAVYWNFEDNIRFTEELFRYLFTKLKLPTVLKIPNRNGTLEEIDFQTPWPRVSLRDLILQDSGLDINEYPEVEGLRAAIRTKNISVDDLDKLARGNLIDSLYKVVSRPKLKGPLFLIEHPTDVSPLARRNDTNPKIVDRFQLIINTWEVLNAYSELVNPLDQAAAFADQAAAKAAGDAEAHGTDDEYIKTMEHGMPPQSGWGMGIERIVALLSAQNNLKDVVLFPLLRPEEDRTQNSDPSLRPATKQPWLQVGRRPGESRKQNGGKESKPEGERMKTEELSTLHSPLSTLHSALSTPLSPLPSREEAWALLCDHVKNPVNRLHNREAEVVLRALATRLGQDLDLWGLTGLLHDLDWEETEQSPEQHALVTAKYLEQNNYPRIMIDAIRRHNADYNGAEAPSTPLDFAIRCGETVTGLIFAAVLVRPDKKIANLEISSLKKKFKEKSFAAKVNRTTILECEKLGLTLEDFLTIAVQAMQEIAEEMGV